MGYQALRTLRAALLGMAFVLPSISPAAVDIATESSTGTAFAATAWAANLSATDLVNAGQATLSLAMTTAPFFGPNGTNDGLAGPNNTTQNAFLSSGADLASSFTEADGKWWATYDLDVSTNPLGYDITTIETFMGWQANSELHANQSYSVEVSTVGSGGFVTLTSVSYTPFTSVNGSDHESHVTITEDATGILASGVDRIRFKFDNPGGGGGSADGTVIREIDVHGAATTVPDTTPPTLAGSNIADDQSGGPVDENTLVTYTVRFSEDMNEGSVSAADFGNAGTAPISFGAISESFPGVFSVALTPTSDGTLRLQVIAGADLTDVAGNRLDTTSAILDDTTITVTVAAPDTSAPDPDPMTFSTTPYASSTTSIAMVASTATDPAGVEYLFTETSGNPGGSDSVWQSSTSYEDTGLTTGMQYTYTVTARDLSANRNATAASPAASATADLPSVVTITSPTSRHIVQRSAAGLGQVVVSGSFTGAPDQIEARAVAPPPTKDLGAIWFIGDSITQSNADGDGNGSPRKSLYDLLVADGYTFSYTGHFTANIDGLPATGGSAATNLYHYHSGISGSCIGANTKGRTNMTAGIPGWWNQGRLAANKPHIVLIMLGTNDIDLNDNVADAPNRIKLLVDTILTQVGAGDPAPTIYVAQIPPNTGSAAESQRVIDFNNALPAVITTLRGEGKDVTLVDQWTPINADTAGLMRDSLHTNTAGNNVLATQWFNAIDARFDVAPSGTTTAWRTIDSSPAAGTWSGTLSNVSAGGWYHLEVRAVTGGVPGASTTREKIGVGDIYVTTGQSNSANYGGPKYTATDDRVSVRTAVTGATWTHAADPMPIAGGSGGSVWSRLGDKLAAADDLPIGFLCVGVGSTQVSQWQPGTSNYNDRLRPAIQSFPANGFRAVLWHQGESDALASVSAAAHESRLNTMIAQSRADAGWDVRWYLAEAAFHPSSNLSQEEPVTSGQRLAAHGDPLVFLGPSTDEFHLEDASGGKLNDSVHFNAAGLLDHARQWCDILRGTVPLTVRNGDFETNRNPAITGLAALTDGATHIVTTTSNNDSPSVLGWRILSAAGTTAADGSNGFHNPANGTYAGAIDSANNGELPNMDGRHVAMLDGGSAGNQFLHSTRFIPQARHAYTLTVAIGVRDNPATFGGARLDLLANGAVVATAGFDKTALDTLHGGDASGTFTDASVTWNTGTILAANQPLAIRIAKTGASGTVLDFDHVRLGATPPFASWIDGFDLDPADQDFGDDPDHDGLVNGFEALFGTDPSQGNAGLTGVSSDGTTASFTHPQGASPPADVSLSYQWSSNLSDWFGSGDGPDGGPAVTMTPNTIGGTTTVSVTPSEQMTRLFVRALATIL